MEEQKRKYCARCGTECGADVNFCMNCGHMEFKDTPPVISGPGVIPGNGFASAEAGGEASARQTGQTAVPREELSNSFNGFTPGKVNNGGEMSNSFNGFTPGKVNNTPLNNSFNGYAPAKDYKDKSKNRKLFAILIPVIAIVLMIASSLAVRFIYMSNEKGDVGGVEYTKGKISGGVYLNEWANLRVKIPDGWITSGSSTYKELEGSSGKVDCGLALESLDGESTFRILFEDIGKYGQTGKTVLEQVEKQLRSETSYSMYSKSFESGGCEIGDSFYSTLTMKLHMAETSITYEYTSYTKMYARVKGKKVIFIAVSGQSKDFVDGFINNVSPIE